MKKNLILLAIAFHYCFLVQAQLCPGGGTTFSNAVFFNPGWVAGCASGTSCSGGTEFDNRAACEPTTAMDACAPAPTCTVNTNGSDIWFKFYASSSSVSIHVIQSVSFIAVIQAFSGSSCAGLTQIGCVVASGPSSGVTLNLSSLTVNQLYYFRVFGSASSASQRTGVFCFCGSTGMSMTVLPVAYRSFKAITQANQVDLSWTTSSENNNDHFDVERSLDGINFTVIGMVRGNGTTSISNSYSFADLNPATGTNYYRLKQVNIDGKAEYSKIVSARTWSGRSIIVFPNPASIKLFIQSSHRQTATLLNSSGQILKTIKLEAGKNEMSVSELNEGIYFIRSEENNVQKFSVMR